MPTMIAGELNMARGGALDADLLAKQPFYGTDFTKPLLFLEDGELLRRAGHSRNTSPAPSGG